MGPADLFLVNLQEPGTEDHARVERMLKALRTPEAVRLARADLARRALEPVRSILPRGDSWEPEYGEGITQEELQDQVEKNRKDAAYVDSLRPDPDAPPPEV